MYIQKAVYENVGPIKRASIDFSFNDDGLPKPTIIVGENGSGKSTVLSCIVDALYEMAGKQFKNALKRDDDLLVPQYYKVISPAEINTMATYMASLLLFSGKNNCYFLKCGKIDFDSFAKEFGLKHDIVNLIKNTNDENPKTVTISREEARNEWSNSVFCYFGPDRFERPAWMGEKYYRIEEYLHPSVKHRMNAELDCPISASNVTASTLQWLLDIISDSRADIGCNNEGQLRAEHINVNELILLRKARTNIETILSKILKEEVYFALNYRNASGSRFKIMRKKDDSVLCNSLDSLSTGQSALFNMFATIIRYADSININNSINMSDINGIVVIDEAELHLHTTLQKEVLPELIKLFPKIQFVITSHSPLFLLGLRDVYEKDAFDVIEMPGATKIDVEMFSEFRHAYDYITQTQKYINDSISSIQSITTNKKALIITEGYTDWQHLEAAMNSLIANKKHDRLFGKNDFEFYKYGPKNSNNEYTYELEMGNDALYKICESISKLPNTNIFIFVADRDHKRTNELLSIKGADYKSWGNNVFSFLLPVPPERNKTPDICIEHLYSDSEIKTEWINPDDRIPRRLYLGNEFDNYGHAMNIQKFCERKDLCGKDKINVIEGSQGDRILDFDNTGVNYALPKSKFAELVLHGIEPFDNFNFKNFVPVFEIIRRIINENS